MADGARARAEAQAVARGTDGRSRHPGPVVVGIDAGLTVTKAVVLDASGRLLGMSVRPSQPLASAGGWLERDLEDQWNSCRLVLREALGSAGVERRQVSAVAVAAHGDGLILLDERGVPVRPGILSLDTRSQSIVADLERDGSAEEIRHRTGRPPASGRPLTLLLWIARHEPAVLRRARWLVFTKDWLKFRLTGEVTTDLSDASAGLLARSKATYDESLLDDLGLGAAIGLLPPIAASDAVAGSVTAAAARETGLPAGIPVASGSHDSFASLVGAGGMVPGTLCLIAGTWSIDAILADSADVSTPGASREVHTRWCLDGHSALVISSSPAGAGLLRTFPVPAGGATGDDRFASVLGGDDRRAESLPTVVPAVRGTASTAFAGAAVLGVTDSHGPVELARASLQAMAFRHRFGRELLAAEATITDVRLTGGLSRSDAWAQLVADSLGEPVVRPLVAEAGAAGAAAMAGTAAGVWPSLASASSAIGAATEIFQPRADLKPALDLRYDSYLSALKGLAQPCPQ